MELDQHKWEVVGTPTDMLSERDGFPLQLIEMDSENYIYVRSLDEQHLKWYAEMETWLSDLLETNSLSRMPWSEMQPNTLALMRIKCLTEPDKIVRVKIMNQAGNKSIVPVYKIDTLDEFLAQQSDLYIIPEPIRMIPAFAVKCILEGTEMFLGSDCIQKMAGVQLVMADQRFCNYSAKLVSVRSDRVPKLRLWEAYDCQSLLLCQIQEMIQWSFHVKLPAKNNMGKVTVTHADSHGFLWLQYQNENLVAVIQKVLRDFDPKLQIGSREGVMEPLAVHDLVGSALDAVYITDFEGLYYRSKVVKYHHDEMYEIEYIDYGNKDLKRGSDLFPARYLDENLCYIPPQCVKVHLYSKSTMDVGKFWDFIDNSLNSACIMVKVLEPKADCPEVEIFVQNKAEESLKDIQLPLIVNEEENSKVVEIVSSTDTGIGSLEIDNVGEIDLEFQPMSLDPMDAATVLNSIMPHDSNYQAFSPPKLDDKKIECNLMENFSFGNELMAMKTGQTALEWLITRFNGQQAKPPFLIKGGFLGEVIVHGALPSNIYAVSILDSLKDLKQLETEMFNFYELIQLQEHGMSFDDLIEKQYYCIYIVSLGRWVRCLIVHKIESQEHPEILAMLIDYAKFINIKFEEVFILPIPTKYLEFLQLGFTLQQQLDTTSGICFDRTGMIGNAYSVHTFPAYHSTPYQGAFPIVKGVFLGKFNAIPDEEILYACGK